MKQTSPRNKARIKIADTTYCYIKSEPIFMSQSLEKFPPHLMPCHDSFLNTTEYTCNSQQVIALI